MGSDVTWLTGGCNYKDRGRYGETELQRRRPGSSLPGEELHDLPTWWRVAHGKVWSMFVRKLLCVRGA